MIRGGSRMQESCTYGSVRGAPSNGRPYRNLHGQAPVGALNTISSIPRQRNFGHRHQLIERRPLDAERVNVGADDVWGKSGG